LNAINQAPNAKGVRHSRYAIIRSSYPALKSTVIKSVIDWFGPIVKIVYDIPIRGMIKTPLPDGTYVECELIFLSTSLDTDVKKLQSLELTGAFINETTEVPFEIFSMLKSRVDRYPSQRGVGTTKKFILCDYNSCDTDHWLYRLAEEIKPEKHSFYAQPPALLFDGKDYRVNPEAENIENLPATYYTDMVYGQDPDWVSVYVLNNYGQVRTGRPVYKAYADRVHCSPVDILPLRGVPLVIGCDVGLDCSIVITQLTPTGQLLVIDEVSCENTSILEFAHDIVWPLLRNKYREFEYEIICDPAAKFRSANDKQSALDIMIRAGLPVRIAYTNEPLARREAVNFFLRKQIGGVSGFSLSPRCKVLRKGFISGYRYSKLSNSNMFKEKPEKNSFSHPHDALQYALLELSKGRVLRKRRHSNRPTSDFKYDGTPATNVGY